MNPRKPAIKRCQLTIDVEPGFKEKAKLLAAKWGVKTNVAIQRAVELASARKWSDDEKRILLNLDTRTEEILRRIIP